MGSTEDAKVMSAKCICVACVQTRLIASILHGCCYGSALVEMMKLTN